MVRIIKINTLGDITKAVKTLNRFKKKIPKITRDLMRKWGAVLERDMKTSLRISGVKRFTGLAESKGIRWEQGKRSNNGFLFMRLYLIHLDSMKPHFVSVNKSRTRLLAWARQARSSSIRKKSRMIENQELKKFSIFVKPHPFIQRGFRTARNKLRPMLNQSIKRGLRR